MRAALNALLEAAIFSLVGTVVVLALFTLFSPQAKPQAAKPRVVIIDDVVRTRLARDWDKHAKDPFQRERAYCARFDTMPFAGDVAYRVFAIEAAETDTATSDAITFSCAAGTVPLHVHPPTTCASETQCVLGGSDAYECFPSPLDVSQVAGDAFGLIQCDRKAVVFYFPQS